MITNPLWVAKTRLCLQYETSQRRYHSLRHTLLTIFREEGLRGWYKVQQITVKNFTAVHLHTRNFFVEGLVPGLFGTSHGALQFMAYDELKKFESENFPVHYFIF